MSVYAHFEFEFTTLFRNWNDQLLWILGFSWWTIQNQLCYIFHFMRLMFSMDARWALKKVTLAPISHRPCFWNMCRMWFDKKKKVLHWKRWCLDGITCCSKLAIMYHMYRCCINNDEIYEVVSILHWEKNVLNCCTICVPITLKITVRTL